MKKDEILKVCTMIQHIADVMVFVGLLCTIGLFSEDIYVRVFFFIIVLLNMIGGGVISFNADSLWCYVVKHGD